MPFHWLRIPSSPPQKRRDDVEKICKEHGARLCEQQTFYDQDGQAYALVEVPGDEARVEQLLDQARCDIVEGPRPRRREGRRREAAPVEEARGAAPQLAPATTSESAARA